MLDENDADGQCSYCGYNIEPEYECALCSVPVCAACIINNTCSNCADKIKQLAASLDVNAIAKAIGEPALAWKSRCYEISGMILKAKIVKGTLCYGTYYGRIAKGSLFAGKPFARHGWILDEDEGYIIDPTRWVFENTDPYIYVGADRHHYDLGASRLRSLTRRPFPATDKQGPYYKLKLNKITLQLLLGPGNWSKLTAAQVHWLATASPNDLQGMAATVYRAIVDAGCKHMVPIDYRTFFLKEGIDECRTAPKKRSKTTR